MVESGISAGGEVMLLDFFPFLYMSSAYYNYILCTCIQSVHTSLFIFSQVP